MQTTKQFFGAWVASAAGAMLAFAGSANAQANLSFSGGNNTPFVLTLSGPVTYVINAAPTGNEPFFVFQNVGNPLGSQQSVFGTISFSIDAGAVQTITNENSGVVIGNIGSNDLFIFGPFSALTIGDVVTLLAGTITTNTSVAGAPPAGGSFTTFLTDSNGVQVSTAGVPEPATWVLLCLGCMSLFGFCWRRGHAASRQV